MKKLLCALLALSSFGCFASDDSLPTVRQLIGGMLRTVTQLGSVADNVSKIAYKRMQKADAADVTQWSGYVFAAHGMHGYAQRWRETHAWDSTKCKFAEKLDCPKYPHFWNRIGAADAKNFSWFHPIQSLKGNVRMLPPVVGVSVASVATGLAYHMVTDYTYGKHCANMKKAAKK